MGRRERGKVFTGSCRNLNGSAGVFLNDRLSRLDLIKSKSARQKTFKCLSIRCRAVLTFPLLLPPWGSGGSQRGRCASFFSIEQVRCLKYQVSGIVVVVFWVLVFEPLQIFEGPGQGAGISQVVVGVQRSVDFAFLIDDSVRVGNAILEQMLGDFYNGGGLKYEKRFRGAVLVCADRFF